MTITHGLIELFGPGDCNAKFLLDHETFKRLVLAAKTDIEGQMDKCLHPGLSEVRETADTSWDKAADLLYDLATEYRLLLIAWYMADKLHSWLDELPQPGDEEAAE